MITVTPADVADVFRPLSEAESWVATGLISQAIAQLRPRVPGFDTLMDDPAKAVLATIAVVNAVKRVLLNPNMMKQVSGTAGPFTESGTFADIVASGTIEFAASDLVGLVPTGTRLPSSTRVKSGYPLPRECW